MKKKKLLATLLACTMLGGVLTGCGGGSTSTPADSSNAGGAETSDASAEAPAESDAAAAPTEGGYSMTLIMSLRDEFLSALEEGAKSAAAELGVTLSTQDANNDTSKLIQYIESARNAGDSAVLVNLVDAETAQQCIDAAGDMKVVFVNRAPADTSVLGENAAFVGSNEMTSGGYQGQFLAEYFKEKGQTDVRYLLLQGTLGLVHTTQRTQSVIEQMEAGGLNPIEAAAPLVAEYDRSTAMDMISPLLTTTEYDCIIANNDAMALGAVEAMLAQGLDPKSIPIVGIDATVDGLQALVDGTLAMTVFQDPNGQGFGALKAAANMIEGKPINEGTDYETDETGNIVWVPFEPVTPDKAAEYQNK